jgi:hypothetical protein
MLISLLVVHTLSAAIANRIVIAALKPAPATSVYLPVEEQVIWLKDAFANPTLTACPITVQHLTPVNLHAMLTNLQVPHTTMDVIVKLLQTVYQVSVQAIFVIQPALGMVHTSMSASVHQILNVLQVIVI